MPPSCASLTSLSFISLWPRDGGNLLPVPLPHHTCHLITFPLACAILSTLSLPHRPCRARAAAPPPPPPPPLTIHASVTAPSASPAVGPPCPACAQFASRRARWLCPAQVKRAPCPSRQHIFLPAHVAHPCRCPVRLSSPPFGPPFPAALPSLLRHGGSCHSQLRVPPPSSIVQTSTPCIPAMRSCPSIPPSTAQALRALPPRLHPCAPSGALRRPPSRKQYNT